MPELALTVLLQAHPAGVLWGHQGNAGRQEWPLGTVLLAAGNWLKKWKLEGLVPSSVSPLFPVAPLLLSRSICAPCLSLGAQGTRQAPRLQVACVLLKAEAVPCLWGLQGVQP